MVASPLANRRNILYNKDMSKKSKQKQKFIYEKDLDNYYELHNDAVDRLVDADEDNVPEVGEAELKQYKSSKLSKIPMWIRALFIKFWFNGAVCFFFLWGLSLFLQNVWDQILVVGFAMGVVTDLLVNNVFRFLADEPNANNKWMMIPQKRFWTIFVNIIYAYAVLSLVVLTYQGINLLITGGTLDEYNFGNFLGVEPFLFGLFYLLFDMLFIGIKDGIVEAVRKVKEARTLKKQQTAAAEGSPDDAAAEAQMPFDETAEPAPPQTVTIVQQVVHTSSKKKHKKKK